MLHDALLQLQASVTKTSSFNSTALDNQGGTPTTNNPMKAQVLYSAASSGTANSTAQFNIEHSDDNSTFYLLTSGADQALTLTTTAANGEIFLPVVTSKRYVRLALVITPGASATPTITYQAYLGLGKP